jgi:hypothetical protein
MDSELIVKALSNHNSSTHPRRSLSLASAATTGLLLDPQGFLAYAFPESVDDRDHYQSRFTSGWLSGTHRAFQGTRATTLTAGPPINPDIARS